MLNAQVVTRLQQSSAMHKLSSCVLAYYNLPRDIYIFIQNTKMPLAKDLLHPSIDEERRKHKKKRLVQSPNSYFMDVKCPGCYKITTVFSHAQTVVLCVGCNYVLCSPSGGKARLTEGCSFRKKRDTPLARKDDTERN